MIKFIMQTDIIVDNDYIYIAKDHMCAQCVLQTREYCTSCYFDRLKRVCSCIW